MFPHDERFEFVKLEFPNVWLSLESGGKWLGGKFYRAPGKSPSSKLGVLDKSGTAPGTKPLDDGGGKYSAKEKKEVLKREEEMKAKEMGTEVKPEEKAKTKQAFARPGERESAIEVKSFPVGETADYVYNYNTGDYEWNNPRYKPASTKAKAEAIAEAKRLSKKDKFLYTVGQEGSALDPDFRYVVRRGFYWGAEWGSYMKGKTVNSQSELADGAEHTYRHNLEQYNAKQSSK